MTDTDHAEAQYGESPRDRDEQSLIDFVLGRCDEPAAEGVRTRLTEDDDFAGLHVDVDLLDKIQQSQEPSESQ